jgi:hypothetical protein
MKKMIGICLFVMFTGAAFAQSDSSGKMGGKMMHDKMKDCIMMKDGKMMVMRGGVSMMMDKDTTVGNGTMVMTNGMVKMTDGSTRMLKDGECVMPNGKVKMMKMDKM